MVHADGHVLAIMQFVQGALYIQTAELMSKVKALFN
jgi:hypothetical protein